MTYPPRAHQPRPPYVRAVAVGLPPHAFHAVPMSMFAAMRAFRDQQREQSLADRDREEIVEWEPINIDGDDANSAPSTEPRRAGHALAVIERLTPDDGVTLMVALGDAASLLLPQLGRPDRLSPAHRVPCRADVFATRGGTPWEHIVDAVMGAAERSAPVTPLTPVLANRLGLGQFLRTRGPVLSLSVVDDPTRDATLASEPPVRVVGTQLAPDAPFEMSRARAVVEGRRARSARRSLFGRVAAWFRRTTTKRERRRWFAALEGRPLAAQLWGTRPTTALLLEPSVRRWVRDTGALAGLQEDTLVKEWEIYWRRRGT